MSERCIDCEGLTVPCRKCMEYMNEMREQEDTTQQWNGLEEEKT